MSSSCKQDYLFSLLNKSKYTLRPSYPFETYPKRDKSGKSNMEDFIDNYDLDKESNASTYDSSQRNKFYNTRYSDTNILRHQKNQNYIDKNYDEERERPDRLRLSGSNNTFLGSYKKNMVYNETKTPREKRNIQPYLETYCREASELDFTKKVSRKYSDKIRLQQSPQLGAQQNDGRRNMNHYFSHRQSRDIQPESPPTPSAYQFLQKSDKMPMFLQQKLSRVDSLKTPESISKNNSKQKSSKEISIQDFALGQCIGQGKFASVYVARLRANGALFAIKKISKQQIKKNKMESQLALEIKLQLFMNHPNILKLYHFFDNDHFIYLIMEYMQQGSLFDCIKRRQDKMNQRQTAEIMIQVSNALTYLHDHDIVHRDIKPENIVISYGVRKLCDFGWATVCTDRRSTYCGTFDYAAPEILQGKDYDVKVDLWCLGILTYQLLIAKVPFHDDSRKETIRKIINSDKQGAVIPNTISLKCRSFIESLLRKRPQQRLCADDLHSHPYLAQYISKDRLYK